MAPVNTSVQISASGERMGDNIITARPNNGVWKWLSLFVTGNEMFIEVSVDIFIHLSPT